MLFRSDALPQIRYGPYPELTWTGVIVGWILGAIIATSIGYAALILGFSIEGSERSEERRVGKEV